MKVVPSTNFQWIIDKTGCGLSAGATAIAAIDASGRIRGMVAYDSWTLNAAQAHMAVESPIVWRSLIRPAFLYPFVEAGRKILIGVIVASNEKSLKMARALGFRDVHRVRDGWTDGEDLCMLEMRRENCRWIGADPRPRLSSDSLLEAL